MKRFFNFLLFVAFTVLLSCDKIDPAEEIPSFIYVEEITIDADYVEYGSSSNLGITDAWVYIDNELIGAFELPAKVPILKKDKQTIKIEAGIKRNGISGNRVKYPMFDPYIVDTLLIQDEILTLEPKVKYNPNISVWFEDFEDAITELYDTPNIDVPLTINNNPSDVYEGVGSGSAIFNSSSTLFEIETANDDFDNLTSGDFVYMELDYATNHDVVVGISYKKSGQTTSTDIGYLTLVATENEGSEWNKIYIDLSEVTQPNAPYEDLEFFIGSQKSSEITYNPKIFIDNVKIISY